MVHNGNWQKERAREKQIDSDRQRIDSLLALLLELGLNVLSYLTIIGVKYGNSKNIEVFIKRLLNQNICFSN